MNAEERLLRQSVLNWYGFARNTSVLVAGDEEGCLTELLAEQCGSVVSLVTQYSSAVQRDEEKTGQQTGRKVRTVVGSPEQIGRTTEERYDYIVLLDVLEQVSDRTAVLKNVMRCLKPGGRLLLTMDNRYGLRYFCAAPDPHTGLPYDGINGYLHGTADRGRSFSRQEITELLHGAGIERFQFFYPVPDARMPQMIFSDRYMKGINTTERLVDYNYEGGLLLGAEHRILCEMIDDGALPFMADAFLIEATDGGPLSDIIYAVTNTDRVPAYALATTVSGRHEVQKRPLYPQGCEHIRQLHRHTEVLKERGIPVVGTSLDGSADRPVITEPYIEAEGLSSAMKRWVRDDREKFLRMFDRIYGCLKQASGGMYEKDGELILKTAYLDLAPCNCFYLSGDDALLFYDQEFTMDDCPAGFAMYRTLKYFYGSLAAARDLVPVGELYARYAIGSGSIGRYEDMEKDFLTRIKQIGRFRELYSGATPDYEAMYEKMRALSAISRAEPRSGSKPYHIGYVPGVFDLFHSGHLKLLEKCKERCDILIVGVLTDELAEHYKKKRPVIPYADRARIIEALEIVDRVIPVDFAITNQLDAWEKLHFDCHFSGDDHIVDWDKAWAALKARGSNMEFFHYTEGISTTQIKAEIIRQQS